jgi:hypothetical protein
MNEKIDAFSKGIFKTGKNSVVFNPAKLYIEAKEGIIYEGSIDFEASIAKDIEVCLSCEEPQFILNYATQSKGRGKIEFSYDATYKEAGFERKTDIHFISSAGEYDIPVEINVVKAEIDSPIGGLSDLFQFAALAKQDPASALEIFLSESFERTFLKGNTEDRLVYRGLIKSRAKEHAMEEFLLFERKKMPVILCVSESELEYHLARKAIKDNITVKRNTWGYTDIPVHCDMDFVQIEKTHISGEDFVSGEAKIPFVLDPLKMHEGKNVATVTVGSGDVALSVRIFADCTASRPVRSSLPFKKKAYAVKLINNFMDFRTHKITTEQFATSNRAVLYGLQVIDNDVLLELAGIHLNLLGKRIAEAKAGLEKAAGRMKDQREFATIYFAFLKAKLYPEDEKASRDAKLMLTRAVAEHPSEWWYVELFLEIGHEKIKRAEDRLRFLREVYGAGCRSEIIYYEAYSILVKKPELFTRLSGFEVQIFNRSERLGLFDPELNEQYVYFAENEKNYDPLVFKHLVSIYEREGSDEVLSAICAVLLKKDKKLNSDFIWFKRAVSKEIRLTGVYEAYMDTADKDVFAALESRVYTYFEYDNSLPDDKKAFLYANVITHRRDRDKTGIYDAYLPQIREFAERMIKTGRMNSHLGIIYDDLFENTDFETEVTEYLPEIIFKNEIVCKVPGIVSVIGLAPELSDEYSATFENGRAYIDAIDNDTVFLTEDLDGNRYIMSAHYDINKIFRTGRLSDVAYEAGSRDRRILIGRTKKASMYHKGNVETTEEYGIIAESEGISGEYRSEAVCTLINYYYDHFEGNLLEEYLGKADLSYLSSEDRTRIIELFMMRDLSELSLKSIKKYGFIGISTKYLLRIFNRSIDEENEEDRDFMLSLAWYIFAGGRADTGVLSFLEKYFVGSTNQYLRLWEELHRVGLPSGNLEERAVTGMLESETVPPGAARLFKSFYKRCIEERNVTARKLIRAFLAFEAYKYLASDDILDDMLFNEMREEIFYDGNDICKMAVLKYYSRKKTLSTDELTFAEEYMRNSAEKGNIMPFFTGFAGKCTLPAGSRNKSFAEVIADPDDLVYIHYRIIGDDEEGEFVTEPILHNYHGIFLKSFTLFYGEAVQYYITIERDGDSEIVLSKVLEIGSDNGEDSITSIGVDESPYQMLNIILLADELNDDMTVKDMMNRFACRNHVIDKLFKPI